MQLHISGFLIQFFKEKKFDKNGDYVKKWIPKLARIPKKFIHKPWEMDKELQKSCDIEIGKDYPLPIVDHAKAREKAFWLLLKKYNLELIFFN